DRLDRLLAQLRVDIQKLHENEVSNFSGGSCPSTPSNSSPRAGLRDAAFVHHVNSDSWDEPLERTLSSSNSGPASILKKRQKARPKMALFEKRPLKRTLTNLSMIDTAASTGGGGPPAFARRDKPPGQVAKVHSEEDDLTLSDAIEDFGSE
ncbi:KCNB1, partial [Symbiodinium sp. CCMP2456]